MDRFSFRKVGNGIVAVTGNAWSGQGPAGCDIDFSDGKGPGAKPLAVEIKDIEGTTGSIVVTVFDKYQAKFRGGIAE